MENKLVQHPTDMTRYALFVYLLISLGTTHAQDTLVEKNSVMYGKYYVLHEDNQFEWYFHHCTGVTYGRGQIKKGLFKWSFVFDSIPVPSLSYSYSNDQQRDSVKFLFRDAADSSFYEPFDIIIANKRCFSFDAETTFPKSLLPHDSINVKVDGDSLTITENTNDLSEVTLYVKNVWKSYIQDGKDILKKRGNSFYLTTVVWIKDEDDYWKKGKRKKYRYVYKLK